MDGLRLTARIGLLNAVAAAHQAAARASLDGLLNDSLDYLRPQRAAPRAKDSREALWEERRCERDFAPQAAGASGGRPYGGSSGGGGGRAEEGLAGG